ncbi:MAG: ABC transporter substrate-binding protein, partial [Alphaproteobacteria bacterium]|nr:ABC transporter substrate-binding protein [Alphaproteobacteria bacterium]
GVGTRNGMGMRFDAVNEQGGIHGRKIKLIVEDNGYNVAKTVAGADKLLKKDKVFALVGTNGTPMSLSIMPTSLKAGVPHLFPIAMSQAMYEPYDRLKFSYFMTYADQMRGAVTYFHKDKGKKAICTLHQDDEFGADVIRGAEEQAAAFGLKLVEKTTYKRGDKDFSSQVAKLRAANCDLVILGTIVSESIGAASEAKKIGWSVDMVVSSAGFVPQVAELAAQGATEGLYGTGQVPIIYPDTAPPEAKIWLDKFKAKYNRDADLQTIYAYSIADLLVAALDKAGKDLTVDSLIKGLEAVQNHRDIFGGAAQSFAPNRRLGADPKTSASLYQIKNKRWVYVDRLAY